MQRVIAVALVVISSIGSAQLAPDDGAAAEEVMKAILPAGNPRPHAVLGRWPIAEAGTGDTGL